MFIYTPNQLSKLDQHTIASQSISSLQLMERAANRVTRRILELASPALPVVILVGIGNNAGDGFAIARLLYQKSYTIHVICLKYGASFSEDAQANLEALPSEIKYSEHKDSTILDLPDYATYIDAVFGVGLNRPMPKFVSNAIAQVNQVKGFKIAIDVPSGMYAHQPNNSNDVCFKTDLCLTFHSPKLSFFCSEHDHNLDRFEVIDIGLDIPEHMNSKLNYTTTVEAKGLLKHRSKFSHKDSFGHALLIGGNFGYHGSIILAAETALRSGLGKLSVHSTKPTHVALTQRLPEAMTTHSGESILSQLTEVLQGDFQAIGVGMGLGQTEAAVKLVSEVLAQSSQPLLLDADALTILAQHSSLLEALPNKSILTPHIGELKRLIGEWSSTYDMLEKAQNFSSQYQVVLVIKEAYTKIVDGEHLWINSSGNHALATAGSGDSLSGIITSLLSQSYEPCQAAMLGVFLHGLTADLGTKHQGHESFIASDIAKYLGQAFQVLKHEQD